MILTHHSLKGVEFFVENIICEFPISIITYCLFLKIYKNLFSGNIPSYSSSILPTSICIKVEKFSLDVEKQSKDN